LEKNKKKKFLKTWKKNSGFFYIPKFRRKWHWGGHKKPKPKFNFFPKHWGPQPKICFYKFRVFVLRAKRSHRNKKTDKKNKKRNTKPGGGGNNRGKLALKIKTQFFWWGGGGGAGRHKKKNKG